MHLGDNVVIQWKQTAEALQDKSSFTNTTVYKVSTEKKKHHHHKNKQQKDATTAPPRQPKPKQEKQQQQDAQVAQQ